MTRALPFDPRALPAIGFFLVLLVAGTVVNPRFTEPFNIASILTQATPLLLVAIGQTFAVGSRGLDLSVGSTVSLSAVLVATTIDRWGPLAIAMALVGAVLVGIVNGLGVAIGLNPFLMTLASLSIVQGFIFTIRDSPGGQVPRWFGELAGYWGTTVPRALPLALGAALLAALVLRRSRLGAHVLAIGGDPDVARLAGIPVARGLIAAYAICSFMAGLAGLFVAARTRTGDPVIGQGFTLDSLAAVVLGGSLLAGGRVTIFGTVFGTLSLSLLAKVLNFSGIDAFYQLPLKGTLLITAALVPIVVMGLREQRRRHRLARPTRGPIAEASP